jgi:hypothetical protein
MVAIVVGAATQQYPQQKYWKFASPRVEILQTGQAAREQAPACGNAADSVKAAEVVAKAGAAALDTYLASSGFPTLFGQGIATAVVNAVNNAGNRQWLRDRLGISHGLSTCATQCVLVPKAQEPTLSYFGCLSETGGDGLDCGANGWMQGQWMGAFNLTHQETTDGVLSCMTGKNWSHSRNRWFWVVATDVNPLNGRPLDKTYR